MNLKVQKYIATELKYIEAWFDDISEKISTLTTCSTSMRKY